MASTIVSDVTDESFASAVLEASEEIPVVVDFWAPWCGPCRTLSPLLERIAAEYAGRVRVVKLNVDEEPQTAARYGVTSIPMVVGFRGGQPAADFLGAQPEPEVRALFEQLVPGVADTRWREGQAAWLRGEPEAAAKHFTAALADDPAHLGAALGLAAVRLRDGEIEAARELVRPHERAPEARQLLASLALLDVGGTADRAELEARLAANDEDAEAHYRLGCLLAAAEQWDPALGHLLRAVDLDRSLDDDGARRRMLDVFAQLGDQHELTRDYQRRLAVVIF